jgi:hypothetical protein
LADGLLRQIGSELRDLQEKAERGLLLYAAELVLDLLLLNEKQSKTGTADLAKYLRDRQSATAEKRVANKMAAIAQLGQTEFF